MSTVALALGLLGVAVSVLALAVAAGTAARVSRIEAGRLPRRIGLADGSAIPADALANLVGEEAARALLRGPTLVLFVSPECSPCRQLVEEAPAELASGWSVVAVEPDGTTARASLQNQAQMAARWLVDSGARLGAAFDTKATPHAFFVRDGVVLDQILGADLEAVSSHLLALHAPSSVA